MLLPACRPLVPLANRLPSTCHVALLLPPLIHDPAVHAPSSLRHTTLAPHRSTLTAAAFGQIFSDVSGVCFGGTVDAAARKVGLPPTEITPAQAGTRRMKLLTTWAQSVGVTIGCLLGMCSLLFMDLEKKDRLKRQAEMNTLFGTLLEEGHCVLNAERCTLFLLSEDGKYLCSKVYRGQLPPDHRMQRAFELVDTEGDGHISKDELLHALTLLGRRPEPEEVRHGVGCRERLYRVLLGSERRTLCLRFVLRVYVISHEDAIHAHVVHIMLTLSFASIQFAITMASYLPPLRDSPALNHFGSHHITSPIVSHCKGRGYHSQSGRDEHGVPELWRVCAVFDQHGFRYVTGTYVVRLSLSLCE